MYYIYSLSDPRTGEVRYIGKTTGTLKARLYSHNYHARRGRDGYVQRWLRSLGTPASIAVLDQAVCVTHLDALEREWISYGRRLGWRLTNSAVGGSGGDCGPEGRR